MKTTARQSCSNLSTENKTPEPTMDRMALLNEILSQNPADPFARYGLAMEYSNAGDVERALDEFKRSEEHTSELQSRVDLVCRLLLEKKKKKMTISSNRHNL